jgi:23S rRNA G2445 N2-methylase RlmL
MTRTRLTAVAFGLAAVCTAGLTAQTQETQTTTKTKVEIKGGKNVTVTGCLEQRSNGDYVLADARDSSRSERSQYALVTNQDLSKHVGERVEIKGKAVTNTDGKVSIESKTKTEVENGDDRETQSKSEGTSGAFDMPYLGVHSIKTLSSSCR